MIFSQMLLNKGEYNGIRLLGSKTVELMTKNHIPAELLPIVDYYLPGLGFGLGFYVMLDPLAILGSEVNLDGQVHIIPILVLIQQKI